MLVTFFLEIDGDSPVYEKLFDQHFPCLPPKDSIYVSADAKRAFKVIDIRFREDRIAAIVQEIQTENLTPAFMKL